MNGVNALAALNNQNTLFDLLLFTLIVSITIMFGTDKKNIHSFMNYMVPKSLCRILVKKGKTRNNSRKN